MSTKITFTYKNHRDITSQREVVPVSISYSSNKWHPIEQWLLVAHDLQRGQTRTFALKDIKDWKEVEETLAWPVDDPRCTCEGFYQPGSCPVHGRHR